MKIRSSTKIAVGFVILAALLYFGYVYVTDAMIVNAKFEPVKPGRINIVGVDTGTGYRIIVANSIAQLVEASSDFEADESSSEGGVTEGAIKKRMPMKELIQTLQGNEVALGKFIMHLNDIRENDEWPAIRVVWTAEDLRKALDGDPRLLNKLEQDLNIKLDGTPLPTLRATSLENGIIVETPVPLQVLVGGEEKTLVGRVQEPYKPRLMKTVEKAYADKNVDRAMQAGYYAQEAQKVLENPSGKENVRVALEGMISKETAMSRVEAPQRILRHATVVVNEDHIESADYTRYQGPDGKWLFDLQIKLTDEGRRRLWKFSKRRIGTQILLVAEGVAIAAPRIEHQLSQDTLTISRMRNEGLVRRAVDLINYKNRTESSVTG